LVAFATRDWATVAAAGAAYWVERKRRLGPVEGLRAAAALRAITRSLRPDWPDPGEREADLADHRQLGEALRRVGERHR
jgi:hypothetical protein